MAGKREENPAVPSNNPRRDVLRVLGVLKVATAEQASRSRPRTLSYRHTDKTPACHRPRLPAATTTAHPPLPLRLLKSPAGQQTAG
ncbi:hypothetical protein [Streptomyces sp. NPDC085596]|uniref:hypothetical protein n=1 Tax=Streptomyces sp. NPDC085596 TaxID=3365731 RepID=UPI0037D026DE